MLDGGFEGFGELLAVRLPRPDIAAGKLEDAESEVALELRVLLTNLLPGPAQALFGQFGDGAGLAEFVAKLSRRFLFFIVGIKRLGKLDEDVASVAAVGDVLG